MKSVDVIIIGAGAAGLMCAIEAGKRGRSVLVIDTANKAGKKILMSGGGRCNFTNLNVEPHNFISHNPHFCKSSLSRYTPADFIELVESYDIPYHEKAHGQLFCDNKSKDILNLLLSECEKANINIQLNTEVLSIKKLDDDSLYQFNVATSSNMISCESLVIATGGLSIPTLGSSPFGYKIAEQFGLNIFPTRAALVPVTFDVTEKEQFSPLSGISVPSIVKSIKGEFTENILFTHRGLSGPAILQISSYWEPGEALFINLLPNHDLGQELEKAIESRSKVILKNFLGQYLPQRVIPTLLGNELLDIPLQELSSSEIKIIKNSIHSWMIKPNGTEGYRTAEVTLGGVDCNEISSKTMEVNKVQGLYFIGEVLDVTGWLGGYNFQWAWASGYVAGQVV